MIEANSHLQVLDRFGKPLEVVLNPDELTSEDIENIELLASMFPGACLIVGLQGSGKTMLISWFAYHFRKYFNIETVSNLHSRSPKEGGSQLLYNGYRYMDDEIFLDDMDRLHEECKKKKYTEKKHRNELAAEVWDKSGISLHKKIIAWDEVYLRFEKRRWMDPLSILYSHVIFQYRHYYSLILMAAPSVNIIDPRANTYVTHEIGCSWEQYRQINNVAYEIKMAHYHIYDRATDNFSILHLYGPNWWPLFDSFQPIQPRRRLIGKKTERGWEKLGG